MNKNKKKPNTSEENGEDGDSVVSDRTSYSGSITSDDEEIDNSVPESNVSETVVNAERDDANHEPYHFDEADFPLEVYFSREILPVYSDSEDGDSVVSDRSSYSGIITSDDEEIVNSDPASNVPDTVVDIEHDHSNGTNSKPNLRYEQNALASLSDSPHERQRKLDDNLIQFLKYEDEDQEIERLLQGGANPNASDANGLTACHWAAFWDDKSLSILIERGADKMKPDKFGLTPLHIAALSGHVRQIAILLGCSKELLRRLRNNINEETEYELKKLRLQVKGFVNVTIRDEQPDVFNNHYKNVFSDLYEDALICLMPGGTPLHLASFYAHSHCVRLLLAAGANPNACDFYGRRPLDVVGFALSKGEDIGNFTDVLKILMKVNHRKSFKKSKHHCSILHTAVAIESLEAVKILVEAGMPVNWLDEDGRTPLHLCIMLEIPNCEEYLKILFKGKCENKHKKAVNVKDKFGCTVLHAAVLQNCKPGVLIALESGVSVTAKDKYQNTALHCAAIVGNLDILNIIMKEAKHKTLIDCVNEFDETPLYLAVLNGNSKCVERLIEKGATTDLDYKDGFNLLHLATSSGHVEIFNIIYNDDDKLTKKIVKQVSEEGNTVMDLACKCGNSDIINLLLSNNAEDHDETYLSADNFKTIITESHKPIETIEKIFDFHIEKAGENNKDEFYEVLVDYGVLLAGNKESDQMKLISEIVAMGDAYGQKRLLLHPLVQSFLHLKWKKLQFVFYMILLVYVIFLASLTSFVLLEFYYKDLRMDEVINILAIVILICFLIILSLEFRYVLISGWRHYFLLETWVKLVSICLGLILIISGPILSVSDRDWIRHVASAALLLSWFEMMLLMAGFPYFGYIVPMFWKVAVNVLKILFTFTFLIIGFCLSFMMQYNFLPPFENFGSALMKTLVMMSSEFDYGDLIPENEAQDFIISVIAVRLIFIIFVIFVAIVLMNFLIAVAVSDIVELEKQGNIVSLEKQVQFLASLDSQAFRKWNKIDKQSYTLYPNFKDKDNVKLPEKLREAIFNIARKNDDSAVLTNECYPGYVFTKNMPQSNKDDYVNSNEIKNIANRMDKLESILTKIHSKLDKY